MEGDWEGFDGKEYVYDDKKEKSYQARIWWAIGVIAFGILISLVVRQVKDNNIVKKYNCVEAEYYNDKHLIYYDEDGISHLTSAPGYPVRTRNGKVLLYYRYNILAASPIGTFASWVPYYLFFGALTGMSAWRLKVIYFGEMKKHKEGE